MEEIATAPETPPPEDNKREEENMPFEKTNEPMMVISVNVSMEDNSEPEVDQMEEKDIGGNGLGKEQQGISNSEGPLKEKFDESPDFPDNPHWIKPELLLEEIWVKKDILKAKDDNLTNFTFPSDPTIILQKGMWQISELCALKDELKQLKMSVDGLPLDLWRSHTKQMELGNSIMSHVAKRFKPEFSSESWANMFEILCGFDIIPMEVYMKARAIKQKTRRNARDRVAFDSVHLCEAPGAFVLALNHYLDNNFYYLFDWNWLATTLNPYHENNHVGNRTITDDRFILKSMSNWTFLKDKTGNILSRENFNHLIELKIKKLDEVCQVRSGALESQVHLVTADGSVDVDMNCETNFAELETHSMSHLQFVEILAAIKILQKGGSFVLKIFTFFEPATICHLYLLCCLFNDVQLFKPATSQEESSEMFVICLEFLGTKSVDSILESQLLPNLENYGKLLEKGKVLLPLESIPKIFIDRIIESAQFFCNYQMNIIRRNLSTFGCDTRIYKVMESFRGKVAVEWIDWNLIKPLTNNQRLFKWNVKDSEKEFRIERPSNLYTLAGRIMRQNGTHFQKIEGLKMDLMLEDTWSEPEYRVINGNNHRVGQAVEWEPPYTYIHCSRFCYGDLLRTREEIRGIVQDYVIELHDHRFGDMANNCSGHNTKRVHDSVAKSCDIELKDFEVLCFSQLTWDFVSKTDLELQKIILQKLFDSLKGIAKNRSMFLCRFPMITRLQTGFIFCLAFVFEKVIIYGDPSKNVVGIILEKFKGLSSPHVDCTVRSISDILQTLQGTEDKLPIVQLAPMALILDSMPAEFLVRYNTLILCQDMLQIINVVEYIIPSGEKDYDAYDFPSPT